MENQLSLPDFNFLVLVPKFLKIIIFPHHERVPIALELVAVDALQILEERQREDRVRARNLEIVVDLDDVDERGLEFLHDVAAVLVLRVSPDLNFERPVDDRAALERLGGGDRVDDFGLASL